ncbi:nucleoside monophosphate kinase [Candidatus Uhrbacteria bacterium]|nr:nucleoside monophosphate kinase [Candidatus Uhrbacteria bacterium]
MYRILLLGPQGSGKGTQGKLLSEKLSIPLISAGALWRAEIAAGTALGRRAEEIIRGGNLAPDNLTAQVVRARLNQADAQKGFILDGYPRNRAQYDLLGEFIAATQVLVLNLSDHEALKRMTGRLVCTKCGTNYHVVYAPPKESRGEGVWHCDEDGVPLTSRDDDKPEAVSKRLQIYRAETEPLLDLYRHRGILREIEASSSIEKIHENIMQALQTGF